MWVNPKLWQKPQISWINYLSDIVIKTDKMWFIKWLSTGFQHSLTFLKFEKENSLAVFF